MPTLQSRAVRHRRRSQAARLALGVGFLILSSARTTQHYGVTRHHHDTCSLNSAREARSPLGSRRSRHPGAPQPAKRTAREPYDSWPTQAQDSQPQPTLTRAPREEPEIRVT